MPQREDHLRMRGRSNSAPGQSLLRKLSLLFAFGLSSLGCQAVGPDYVAPEFEGPEAFKAPQAGGLAVEAADLNEWWQRFEDPLLNSLITETLTGNLDLKAALVRIEEARALRGIVAADQVPTIDVSGSRVRTQQSRETVLGNFGPRRFGTYSVGLEADWELDIWGRIRRSVEAADAEISASGEEARLVLVSLMAETASTYIEWRRVLEQLNIAGTNVELQSQTVQLTENQFKANLVSQLDVAQARSLLQSTRATIPSLRVAEWKARNRLAVLTGVAPGTLALDENVGRGIPRAAGKVGTGVPAELIRRRPDIRLAERLLAAQTARVGVAEGDLYPRFSFMGNIGFDALDLDDLVASRAVRYGFGPSLRWNIFDRTRVRGAVDVADARVDAALLEYENTVLLALEEVENAMVLYAESQGREEALKLAVTEARRAVDISRDQYRQGLVGFQSVIDTQNRQFSLEADLANVQADISTSLIGLYRAMGGGWEARDVFLQDSAQVQQSGTSASAPSEQPKP